jgi:hypothetical protein
MMVLNAATATGMANVTPLPLPNSATQHDKVAEWGIPPHGYKALAYWHKQTGQRGATQDEGKAWWQEEAAYVPSPFCTSYPPTFLLPLLSCLTILDKA